MIRPEQQVAGIKWIETERLTAEERQLLQERYAIDEDIMTYVTDKDESANYVHDINEGDQLFIFWHLIRLIGKIYVILPGRLRFCFIKADYLPLMKAAFGK